MPALTEDRLAALLLPYMDDPSVNATGDVALTRRSDLYPKLLAYLDLLLTWNARTNLTAIRNPEEIVRRHFGESLFAGLHLAGRVKAGSSVLDFGSGAGFPGLPVQLLLPEVNVVLAESQGKKVAFLREAVRVLRLSTEVWGARVEHMESDRRFEAVMLRAVDRMVDMVEMASQRVMPGGWLLRVGSESETSRGEIIRVPGSHSGVLQFSRIG